MGDLSDMSFWSLQVPPGKALRYEVEQTLHTAQYVHVTNVALPLNAVAGTHTITVQVREQEVTLATLEKGKFYQHPLDFVLDEPCHFRVYGPGPIHVVGYQTISEERDQRRGDDDEDDEDYSDEEDEDDSDDEAPQAVPIANGKAGKGRGRAPAKLDEEDDEEDEDEDDEDFPSELNSDDVVGEFDDADEDEDMDEGEEGEEDEDEEEEEEEEEEAKPPPKAAAGTKRPTQQPLTPAPKKQKRPEGKAAPASAPPKQQQDKAAAKGADTPGATPKTPQEYEKALITYLKSQPGHAAPMAQLGTRVHKPAGISQLSKFIKDKPQFRIENNGQTLKYTGK